MKYSTFQKRACMIAEKTLEKGKTRLLYQNTPEALYFLPDAHKAYYAYRLEGSELAEQPDDKAGKVDFEKKFNDCMGTAVLAPIREESSVKVFGKETRIIKFTTEDGTRCNVFDHKYVKLFPDNAKFYLPRGKWSPAVVGLWENDRLNVIGIVCPMNV